VAVKLRTDPDEVVLAVPEVRSVLRLSSSSLLIFSSSSVFMASTSNVRSLCRPQTGTRTQFVRVSACIIHCISVCVCVCVTSRCCIAPCCSHSYLCWITCRHSSLYTPGGGDRVWRLRLFGVLAATPYVLLIYGNAFHLLKIIL